MTAWLQLADELRGAGAEEVVTYADDDTLVSRDGDATAVLVGLGFDAEDNVPAVFDVVQTLDDEPGYTAAVTGEWTSDADVNELSLEDLKKGELLRRRRPPSSSCCSSSARSSRVSSHSFSPSSRSSSRSRSWHSCAGVRPVGLHSEHVDRHGSRARDRLCALHLSRYREERLQGRSEPDAIAT